MDCSKQIKLVLANGLFVYGARVKTNGLVILYLTDHEINSRLFLDVDSKKILYNKHGITLTDGDFKEINKALTKEIEKPKQKEEKVEVPLDKPEDEIMF